MLANIFAAVVELSPVCATADDRMLTPPSVIESILFAPPAVPPLIWIVPVAVVPSTAPPILSVFAAFTPATAPLIEKLALATVPAEAPENPIEPDAVLPSVAPVRAIVPDAKVPGDPAVTLNPPTALEYRAFPVLGRYVPFEDLIASSRIDCSIDSLLPRILSAFSARLIPFLMVARLLCRALD